jgi:hypothetical protein
MRERRPAYKPEEGCCGGELWANDLEEAPKAGEPRSLASSTGGGP